ENLPVPSEAERRVLRRIGAPPGVRLACQIPVTAPLEVTPLLPPASSPSAALGDDANRHGRERDLAVLFCDIRGFTAFSEHRLPYDVVFVLNRYFRAMSEQVQANGGYVDKFIGDGLMALFGLEADRATASRQAIAAVRSLAEGLERLNLELSDELDGPLQIGIGVHIGPVIVGELGHGRAASLTAIGDTVNVASRLEVMTKEHQCEAVISQDLADAAGISTDSLVHAELLIRGRSQPLSVVILPQAGDLSASA
ncbi:MAG TPA: adenylate/guanylate cyclase domain-containing protein, partial [Alphaproteobacteria bacterium]|nr:adenylate/guanylate cyclase domain-containing protein [Alphaproteobacteria bacterium]